MLGVRNTGGGGGVDSSPAPLSKVTTAAYPTNEFVPAIHRRETALPLTIAFIVRSLHVERLMRLLTDLIADTGLVLYPPQTLDSHCDCQVTMVGRPLDILRHGK